MRAWPLHCFFLLVAGLGWVADGTKNRVTRWPGARQWALFLDFLLQWSWSYVMQNDEDARNEVFGHQHSDCSCCVVVDSHAARALDGGFGKALSYRGCAVFGCDDAMP